MDSNQGEQGLYRREFEHDSCGVGFVAHIKGTASPDIVKRGLVILERMEHRGAEGADNKTGDGSGIMIQLPHDFFRRMVPGIPDPGEYAAGMVFMPRDEKLAVMCRDEFESIIEEEGLTSIAWRDVPVDDSWIGEIARRSEPVIRQIFIRNPGFDEEFFERKLYIIRKTIERRVRSLDIMDGSFYIPSLSSRTIVYKGMLTPSQVGKYFTDLANDLMSSSIALVHSRFSTNTFPSWDLAQPFRFMAHNGEINTVKGNRFWMQARENDFSNDLFGSDIGRILPVIEPGKSDSASLDNALELLVSAGRTLPHALMMLIPESWNDKNPIPDDLKYFYEYHSTLMEPWDGPASVVFSDGRFVGGTLDRNGLRPSRYVITTDDLIVMASESGVQEFPPERIIRKGRLMPGKLLLVDTREGRIIPDEEIKKLVAHQSPYRKWVEENRILLSDLADAESVNESIQGERLQTLQTAFGYTREDVEDLIIPTVNLRQEPTGSMGTDTPLAVLSGKHQSLFNYFKQVFAQVTNPPIDPIREELVMSLTSYMGARGNMLEDTPEHCRKIKFFHPVLTPGELEKIRRGESAGIKSVTFRSTFPVADGVHGMEEALRRLFKEIEDRIDRGAEYVILSDRSVNRDNAPLPSLMACAGLHHYLIRKKKRNRVALLIETGEAREVMHFALLFGYGADAVCPYLVYASYRDQAFAKKLDPQITPQDADGNYIKAMDKGLLKILSKMGTSTLRSYRGAQIFEAVGLSADVIDGYFTGTMSRIGGLNASGIAREVLEQHAKAFSGRNLMLESSGVYHYRKGGEKHAWNPESIYLLQWATRTGDYDRYRDFTDHVDRFNRTPHVIRGLLDLKNGSPIPIDEVEAEESILRRLTTGAMSFGSISREAHEAIAIAMNTIGGRSNCGEGGEDPARFIRRPDGTLARSSIKQVASGRFGVTSNYLANADEIQIKIAQGAKPGEGGQLPGFKVDQVIARTRFSTPGVTLISPPPHHDIYSIEDLAQLIYDMKCANPGARISVKLVSESGVGTIAAGVAKAHADVILISGYDGGTGASPLSSIKHAGLPWEIGLAETQQTLVMNNLRGRVILQTDGQLKTGRDVVIAAALGAEEFGFGTGALIVLGCIMMRKCHLNTCPVGVATQDPELRKRFTGRPEYLVNYFRFMAREIREIMASLGITRFDDLVGNTGLLVQREPDFWKAGTLDLSSLLHRPAETHHNPVRFIPGPSRHVESLHDHRIIERIKPAIDGGRECGIYMDMPVRNTDRSVGTLLSYEISSRFGEAGLPDDTIQCTFRGTAGQSFGAFLTKGVTFRLEGDANDYLGKGLSGGRLIVLPPQGSTFPAEDNIIAGNTVLYGATGGEAYLRGVVGERFCVRNSGAVAVVEGAGDHCAEYMTGGRIIVLGRVGRNFAAGMSGGIAYVLDADGNFEYYCNRGMVDLSPVRDFDDQDFIIEQIHRHVRFTGSHLGKQVLDGWYEYLPKFVKIISFEYRRALNEEHMAQIDDKLRRIREEEQLEVTI